MKSIAFPNIFSDNKTKINTYSDYDATLSNLKLLITSYKNQLFGDPYFGTNLLQVIYSNNDGILKDLIIDDIYSSIYTFIPQIRVNRNDITIDGDGRKLYVTIKAINLLNGKSDLYNINLLQENQE